MAYTPLPDFQKWVDAVFRLTKGAFQPKKFPRFGGPAPPVEYSALPQYTQFKHEAKTKSQQYAVGIPAFLRKKGSVAEMEKNLWTVWNDWSDPPMSGPAPNSMTSPKFIRLGVAEGKVGDITNFNLGMGSSKALLGPFSFEGPTAPWMQLCGDGFLPKKSKWFMHGTGKVGEANEYGKEGKGTLNKYFTFTIGESTVHNFPMQPGYTYLFTDALDTPLQQGKSIWFLTYADEPQPNKITKWEDEMGLFPRPIVGFENATKPISKMLSPNDPAIYGIGFKFDDVGNKWNATIQNLTYGDMAHPFSVKKMSFPQPDWLRKDAQTAVVFRNKGPVNDIIQLQPLERFEYISDLKNRGLAGRMHLWREGGIIVANFAVTQPDIGWKVAFKKELDKRHPKPPPKKPKKPKHHPAAAASESEKETLEWIKKNYPHEK